MIDRIKESRSESCKEEVQKIFEEKQVLFNIKIERAHRINNWGKNKTRPRIIACKLLSYEEKILILNKSYQKLLKGTNSYVNDDFTYDTIVYKNNSGRK